MASFGAKYPRFNKIAEEPENALPKYDPAGPISIGRLVKAELSVSMASGKLYADDQLAEAVDEFVSGSIAMETDEIADAAAGTVYGATVQDKRVSYKAGDTAPMGGLAYYKVLMRNGKKLFKGFFYPRVKAILGNDTATTKGDSITFGTSATTFTVFSCNSGDWRITEEFETEAEAKTWVDTQLGKENDNGGKTATPTANPEAGAVANGSKVALASTTAGAKIYYTVDGSNPTQSSTEYTAPIEITQAVTIKAKAYAAGHTASDMLTAAYTISE